MTLYVCCVLPNISRINESQADDLPGTSWFSTLDYKAIVGGVKWKKIALSRYIQHLYQVLILGIFSCHGKLLEFMVRVFLLFRRQFYFRSRLQTLVYSLWKLTLKTPNCEPFQQNRFESRSRRIWSSKQIVLVLLPKCECLNAVLGNGLKNGCLCHIRCGKLNTGHPDMSAQYKR